MATSRPPGTLRERRRQETHDHIHRVAVDLVRERGYEAVTTEMISDQAGVSVRTFFNYYSTKESALVAAPPPVPESAIQDFLAGKGYRSLFTDLADLAQSQLSETGREVTDFEVTMQLVMSVPALAKLQFTALTDFETQMTELVAARLGVESDGERPAVIAAAFTGAMRIACQRWSRNPDGRPLAEEVRACLTVLSVAAPGTGISGR